MLKQGWLGYVAVNRPGKRDLFRDSDMLQRSPKRKASPGLRLTPGNRAVTLQGEGAGEKGV